MSLKTSPRAPRDARVMGQALCFTQQLLALSATLLCLPFRKLWANNDAWRKGSQLGLCVAQKAATPSIVAWAKMGEEEEEEARGE